MSQYLQDTLFELEVLADGAEPPKTPLTGCKIKKHKGAFLFYVGKEPSDVLTLPIDTVASAKPNYEHCTLEIKTKKNETYKLTFYIQSHLNFFAEHLPKHLSTQFKIKEQPEDEATAEVDTPKVMKNPLVLIIAISEYSNPDKNLPSSKCDLAAYRNLFENEYRWTVRPRKGSAMNRKAFWTRSDILNFLKEESEQLFDNRLCDSHDGLVVVLRGHGGDGTLIDSEGTHVPLTFLHDMVSYAQDPRFEAVPRLFIVDACRGWRGFFDEDEKQSQGTDIQPQGEYWRHNATHGQRNNLAALYGTVSGFVTWATKKKGAFSSAVIETLKQNARRQKQLAFLVTDIRKELKNQKKDQILVFDGDASLNPLWIRPKDKTQACSSEEITQVVLWLQYLTNCSLKPDSFFESICDGHLLCSALNAIRPGTCSIKYPTAAEESRHENIQQFITGCKYKFGVDERFVIEPEALDSKRTIIDVLCTLYALYVTVVKRGYYKGEAIPGARCEEVRGGKGRKAWHYIGRIDGAGQIMGYGKKIYENTGASYTGGYVNGLREGTGTYVKSNGDVYYGEWKNDQHDGHGKFVSANGKLWYEGDFKEEAPHGYGKQSEEDGDVYEGEWENGEWNGFGCLYEASGDVYIGDFKDGQRHGRGWYCWADGRVCVVEFEKDEEIRPSPQ